jgi:hypothetical protein
MMSDDLFFWITVGAITPILVVIALVLRRRWRRPTLSLDTVEEMNERNTMAVAMRCWQTGKPQFGEVDEHGNLTITEIDSETK